MTNPSHRVLVVRRGDIGRLHRLKLKFDQLPVEVVVDRRLEDRRWRRTPWPVERRGHERRQGWPDRFPSSALLAVPAPLKDDVIAPARGDVVVTSLGQSLPDAAFGLLLVPGQVQSRYDTYDLAVEHGKRFARYAATDLWYTEDERTFVLLEVFRVLPPIAP